MCTIILVTKILLWSRSNQVAVWLACCRRVIRRSDIRDPEDLLHVAPSAAWANKVRGRPIEKPMKQTSLVSQLTVERAGA